MNDKTRELVLISEERKAVRLFLWLFYFIYIGYDLFYYLIYPTSVNKEPGLPEDGLGFVMYIAIFIPLLLAFYFIKKKNPYPIKYLYLGVYLTVEFVNYFMIYYGEDIPFRGGHVIELLFILFSPIYVNKKYFWFVSIPMLLKYVVYGMFFHSPNVILPVILILFVILVAFIILNRFYSYMGALSKAHEDLREREKLAVIGRMATAIAHEIKNPLSSLKGFTQLQQEKDKGDEQYYSIMLNEIDRINSIVTDLLVLGKPNTAIKKPVSLLEIIEYVLTIIKSHSVRKNIKIELKNNNSIVLLCDENQLKQVFINIIKNAMEAMPDGGTVTIDSEVNDERAFISVRDEGCGIPPDKIAKLGEPFYTTKQNGNGLGLMVTKKIIEEHEGTFNIESELEKGTSVTITLPIVK
jgi:signal transduction histidine kinase